MKMRDPQSFNRYAYVQNDPLNFVDPSGLNVAAPGGGISIGSGYCWFVSQYISDKLTLVGGGCMADPGGDGPGDGDTGGGGIDEDKAGREKLTGDRKKAYESEKEKAKAGLKNSDCQKFLTDSGINPQDAAKALDKQRAFDVLTSTISLGAAGVVASNASSANLPIDVLFREDPDLYALTAGYAPPGSGATGYDTYFGTNGLTSWTILHEKNPAKNRNNPK